jgi:hypothetical protein
MVKSNDQEAEIMSDSQINSELAQQILANASALGVGVEDYLRLIIAQNPATAAQADLTPQERAQQWREFVNRHNLQAPPLSDEAISRENIYREREDHQL